ncbi:lipocalin family protein [uncultured Croceitalea sp.]|uniref:lipocalin family protein n=1 Tax=uncultured Croceitalea sp. TaxID=1798908 RepID=UPI0033066FE5
MRTFFPFLICFLLLVPGCTSRVEKSELEQLNGYWEIVEVVFPDGQKKSYSINPTIDYIEIDGMKGFKKKVQPKFDGTYDTSDDAELFNFIEKENTFVFHYKNGLSEWHERLTKLNSDEFSMVNQDGIEYSYKRYQPINITPK